MGDFEDLTLEAFGLTYDQAHRKCVEREAKLETEVARLRKIIAGMHDPAACWYCLDGSPCHIADALKEGE